MSAEIINIDPSQRIREVHICFYVTRDGNKLHLKRMVEAYYQHPDGPAEIQKFEVEEVLVTDINSVVNPEVFLMYNNQRLLDKLYIEK